MESRAPRILLVCSGLEHARRGYESFASECFEALRGHPGIELELVKGSGQPRRGELRVAPLRRDRTPARAVGRAIGWPAFRVEALSFAFTLLPLIVRQRPDLVYLHEWDTARGLAWIRAAAGFRFGLLLINGGFAERGFEHLDHVQELTPAARDHVIKLGADPSRHTMLPLGFRIEPELKLMDGAARAALRDKLRLPRDRRIVLSVAAFNRHHKRLDYLIEELGRLPEPRPFLLLAGEPDPEADGLRDLARRRLGDSGFAMRTVPSEHVPDLYRASDAFVLASLTEAQGRVLVEAMAHGLPCIANDGPVMRFALGEHGVFGDMSRPGVLASQIADTPASAPDRAREAHRYVYERFSWDRLRPRYVELLRRVASANSTVSSSTGEKVPRYS